MILKYANTFINDSKSIQSSNLYKIADRFGVPVQVVIDTLNKHRIKIISDRTAILHEEAFCMFHVEHWAEIVL